jgi:aminopeptidase N
MRGYHAYMQGMRGGITNQKPVAPRRKLNSVEVYNGDIYSKGAWILHTLRYLMGDEPMAAFLRRMAYPDSDAQVDSAGCRCRFVSTDDALFTAEAIDGRDLDWFFDVYLRQEELPRLVARRNGADLHLQWEVPDGLSFPMPVPVQIDGEIHHVEMADGSATIRIPEDAEPDIDPEGWLLREAE